VDFDLMAAGRQSERLRGRREFARGPDERAVDEHFGGAGRDLETHAAGIGLALIGLNADRS